MMTAHRQKRFSTILTTTIIVLVLITVTTLLWVLNSYFANRVEQQFRKQLQAQKGQVQLLIKNRLNQIRQYVKNMGNDNSIRVTLMLDAETQLMERLHNDYPPENGLFPFVMKMGSARIYPEQYQELPAGLVLEMLQQRPRGKVWCEPSSVSILWHFSAPIMHIADRMGTVIVIYDAVRDSALLKTIRRTVDGQLAVLDAGKLCYPLSGRIHEIAGVPPSTASGVIETQDTMETLYLAKLEGFANLYYLDSGQALIREKRGMTLLLGLLSIMILGIAILISIRLSRKMTEPLREMTQKAVQISKGHHDQGFEDEGLKYWEYIQLSQAFDYMLQHLKMAEERSRYKELFENVDDAVYILNRQGRVIEANTAAYGQLGYTDRQFFSLSLADIIPAAEARSLLETLGNTAVIPAVEKVALETFHYRKDGASVPVEIRSRLITYRDETVILNVARDVSRRKEIESKQKELEAQLHQAQKMEAVGTLAGGIAHDFNNLLMGMQGHLSVMRLKTDHAHDYFKHIESIEHIIKSASNLTRQLLGFARKGKYEIAATDLGQLVENSARMFIRAKKEIGLQLRCHPALWTAMVDPGQIEQVLLNLYVNALQAMPDGGEFFVETDNVHLTEDFCRPYHVHAGRYVKISVTDTGVGMDKAVQERIFEPFFTTKEVGKGTGLGLASVYSIVNMHQGIIQVYSEKGFGTTFNIYLPAAAAQKPVQRASPAVLIRGSGRILLVDDEDEAIQAETMMLREIGYEVLRARRGREAIEMFGTAAAPIDLVVLDMIMPEMSAKEVHRGLQALAPHVKVLLISGYSRNRQVEEMLKAGCNGFLQKPFDIYQLSQKIDSIMRHSSS